jgi:hypothetical protein
MRKNFQDLQTLARFIVARFTNFLRAILPEIFLNAGVDIIVF